MSDNELNKIMNEMMASLSEESREAMMRRINSERLIKLVAENLVEKHEAESIRVIPDNRLTAQDAADYLIQVDDYDMRLVLLDSPGGKVKVTKELLQQWMELFEDNPSTTILIAVWTNDELSSIAFTTRLIRSIMDSESKVEKIAEIAKSFETVISEQIRGQIKRWKIPKTESSTLHIAGRDLFGIFSKKISSAIDNEASKKYRTEQRVQAAKNFPADQEKRTLLATLRNALDGASIAELESQMTKLPRRGGQ